MSPKDKQKGTTLIFTFMFTYVHTEHNGKKGQKKEKKKKRDKIKYRLTKRTHLNMESISRCKKMYRKSGQTDFKPYTW